MKGRAIRVNRAHLRAAVLYEQLANLCSRIGDTQRAREYRGRALRHRSDARGGEELVR
jgi:hypothetical protein